MTHCDDVMDSRSSFVDKSGLSDHPLSPALRDDIPFAERDEEVPVVVTVAPPPRRPWFRARWVLLGWAIAGLFLVLLVGYVSTQQQPASAPQPASVSTPVAAPALPLPLSPSATPAPSPADALLGHLPYAEAPAESLRPISRDRRIKLRESAAIRFREMVAAARRDGVRLVPLSGFRGIEEQNYLFFGVKARQGESARERAEVSAPPGYSEHHTGYAVDIGDATRPDADLQPAFEQTSAARWLQDNAARFNFELSFPRNNPQGIRYEPWHWRFVGDRDSLETFYKARSVQPNPTPVTQDQ